MGSLLWVYVNHTVGVRENSPHTVKRHNSRSVKLWFDFQSLSLSLSFYQYMSEAHLLMMFNQLTSIFYTRCFSTDYDLNTYCACDSWHADRVVSLPRNFALPRDDGRPYVNTSTSFPCHMILEFFHCHTITVFSFSDALRKGNFLHILWYPIDLKQTSWKWLCACVYHSACT